MNDRIIEIENYWARVVRDTAEFQQIADAENPEFNTVLKCLYNILKDGFINDLTENGAMRWEKILALPVSSTATLEERKVQILTYLSIRRPYTIRILRKMLSAIMGEGNHKLNINNDTSTLTIALASTVDTMREKIDELCTRVIPQNLVIEYDQGLPIDYTPVVYLKSTGTQYIDTRAYNVDAYILDYRSGGATYHNRVMGYARSDSKRSFGVTCGSEIMLCVKNSGYIRSTGVSSSQRHRLEYSVGMNLECLIDGELTSMPTSVAVNSTNTFEGDLSMYLFANNIGTGAASGLGYCYIYGCSLTDNNGVKVRDFIPALDNTGCPCMFDIVSRKPFYNSGTGDFIYPTDAAPVMTLDLDEKFYAKRTEHGIRRLYRVPEGCTMSKDEYAAKNGFKEILEPPMPQEGYWVPEWHETETQLICEWVETEPPTEEGIENE